MEKVKRSIKVDTSGLRDQGDVGQNCETQSENLLLSNDRLSNIEIDTETACIKEPAVPEQIEQRKYGQDQRMPDWQKTFSEHKHFPFGNRSVSKCNNYIQDKDDVGQSIKETGQLITNVGYGRRIPAWQTELATHLQSPVQNESTEQCGKHTEDEVDQTLKKEIMDYMDDPRKGAYNLGKDS